MPLASNRTADGVGRRDGAAADPLGGGRPGWAPLQAFDRLRALVGRWPTDRVALYYPVFVRLVVGVHELLE